ncbi:MAG TPA: transporter substrate-binding domain-containing protein [Ideonella sp.]|uniref:substrate-binding periplasmic protein n=1 Tax=Ideonella sp. TaxID=1929293 RepID=UPI002E31BA34|nr:transporter substrate-binding domain-containing protein [Ideonella sp.]HEX5685947.1 transporter substrate-binding domain-containing protein [Ideonella sp.]
MMRTLACLLFLVLCGPVQATRVEVVTTDAPPFNMLEGDTPSGFATDILLEVLQQAGLDHHIRLLPWPRALLTVKQEPNTLIYTISRTPEREAQFEWIGPFALHQGFFYKLSSRTDIRLANLRDVRKYRVATVRGDAQTDLMLKLDIVDRDLLQLVSDGDTTIRLLLAGRVDLVIANEIGIAWRMKLHGLSGVEVERTVMLVDNGGYYFAFGKGADPALVAAVRKAFAEVRDKGQPQRLLERYLPGCKGWARGCPQLAR